MNTPRISVIVPVYNTSLWLRRCLESICAQSYRNLEILCINDGSTDNSADILEEYAAMDERIKVITQVNAGLSAARNTGLECATGEWITGVDSDDYLYPEIYKQAIAYVDDEVDLIFFGVQKESEQGKKIRTGSYLKLPEKPVYSMTPDFAHTLNACFWSKLWRRSLIEKHELRFPVGLVHEDEALYWSFVPDVRKVAICPAIGYIYMQRDGSIMHEKELDLCSNLKRKLPVLKYVQALYCAKGRMSIQHKDYLKFMFIRFCCDYYWIKPLPQRKEVRQLIASIIQECDMINLDCRLDRFVSSVRLNRMDISLLGAWLSHLRLLVLSLFCK